MKAHAQLPGSHVQEGQEFAEEVEVQEGLELAEADEVVVDVESRAVVVADLLAYDVPLLANLPLALGLVASAEACRRCRLCRVRGLSGISRGCVRAFVVDVLLPKIGDDESKKRNKRGTRHVGTYSAGSACRRCSNRR